VKRHELFTSIGQLVTRIRAARGGCRFWNRLEMCN